MRVAETIGLSFDDVVILPAYSDIHSRLNGEIDIGGNLTPKISLSVPIVSANMDSITGSRLANAMAEAGGAGILHRFMSLEKNLDEINALDEDIPHIFSIGIGKEAMERLQFIMTASATKPVAVCIDIAHGDCAGMVEQIKTTRELYPDLEIIAGNVGTYGGATRLIEAGVDAVKVGLGNGFCCSTRVVTGCGVPQLTAIDQVRHAIESTHRDVVLIADGGLKNSGDIVKSLAAGADCVMTGSLVAGTMEAIGETLLMDGKRYKSYRGLASIAAQKDWKGCVSVVEGEGGVVPYKGPVADVIDTLARGIKSGFSYVGARNIRQLRENAVFMRQTQAGYYEGLPRISLG